MTEEKIKRIEEIHKVIEDNRLESSKIENYIQLLSERLKVLKQEEILAIDELIKFKEPDASKYIGSFVRVKNENQTSYIYVTDLKFDDILFSYYSNEKFFCTLSGPFFDLSNVPENNNIYVFSMQSEHGQENPGAVIVKNPEDMEIITSEEFYSAYDKLCEQAKKYLIESIDNKPTNSFN